MKGTQLTLIRHDIWDLNHGNIPEFPVDNPPGWDAVSLYYAKALQQMGWQQPTGQVNEVTDMWAYSETPNTYFFQAAMHWTPLDNPLPYWDHCTHEGATSPYFLAWHRAYIYFFEIIVRSYVTSLGGPSTWALPYWNYSSAFDDSDPSEPWPRSSLPWVFSQAQLPDGTGNPLYIADVNIRGLQGSRDLEPTTPYYYQAYKITDFDSFNVPYSYTYQDLPATPPPVPPGVAAVARAVPEVAARPAVVARAAAISAAASAPGPVALGTEPVSTVIPLHEQMQVTVAHLTAPPAGAETPHMVLRLTGITADRPPRNYAIYLDYPQADRETAASVPQYVGLLAPFGADHHHGHAGQGGDAGPHGLSANYDISAVVAYLRSSGGWDDAQATVTFVPAVRPRPGAVLTDSGLRIASITIEGF